MNSLNSGTPLAAVHPAPSPSPLTPALAASTLTALSLSFFLWLSHRGRVQEMETAAASRHSHRGQSVSFSLPASLSHFLSLFPILSLCLCLFPSLSLATQRILSSSHFHSLSPSVSRSRRGVSLETRATSEPARVSSFLFRALFKARAQGETDGGPYFVRYTVTIDQRDHTTAPSRSERTAKPRPSRSEAGREAGTGGGGDPVEGQRGGSRETGNRWRDPSSLSRTAQIFEIFQRNIAIDIVAGAVLRKSRASISVGEHIYTHTHAFDPGGIQSGATFFISRAERLNGSRKNAVRRSHGRKADLFNRPGVYFKKSLALARFAERRAVGFNRVPRRNFPRARPVQTVKNVRRTDPARASEREDRRGIFGHKG